MRELPRHPGTDRPCAELPRPHVPAAPFRAPLRKTEISNHCHVLNPQACVAAVPASSPKIVPPVLQAEGVPWLALGKGAIQVAVPFDANSDAPPLKNTCYSKRSMGSEIC